MTPRLRIALAAEEAAGVRTLNWLAAGPHELVAVLASPAGAGRHGGRVGQQAERLKVPLWEPERVADPAFAVRLGEWGVDLLLNVHALHVATSAVVEAPRIGSFNLHPGPLPSYAGLNVPSWAILHCERFHAVTLHRMRAGIDTGEVAGAAHMPIDPQETGLSLSLKCVQRGLPLVQCLVQTAARDPQAIAATAQPLAGRRYYGSAPPYDGVMPWHEPARTIDALLRAGNYGPFASPWPRPTFHARRGVFAVARAIPTGRPAGVAPGTVGGAVDGARWVAAGDDWVAVEALERDGAAAAPAEVLERGEMLHAHPPPRTGGRAE